MGIKFLIEHDVRPIPNRSTGWQRGDPIVKCPILAYWTDELMGPQQACVKEPLLPVVEMKRPLAIDFLIFLSSKTDCSKIGRTGSGDVRHAEVAAKGNPCENPNPHDEDYKQHRLDDGKSSSV